MRLLLQGSGSGSTLGMYSVVGLASIDGQTLGMAIYSVFEGVSISAIDVQNNFYYPMHIFQ